MMLWVVGDRMLMRAWRVQAEDLRASGHSIADPGVLQLIQQFLTAGVLHEPGLAGTPHGGVISPLLANIYLNGLDHALHAQGFDMICYADDCVICCPTAAAAQAAFIVVRQWTDAHRLTLHPEKTSTVDLTHQGASIDFLGTGIQSHQVAECLLCQPAAGFTYQSVGTEPGPVGHTPIGPRQLESRVRENRSHGSEGGVAHSGHPYPYRVGRSYRGIFTHRRLIFAQLRAFPSACRWGATERDSMSRRGTQITGLSDTERQALCRSTTA